MANVMMLVSEGEAVMGETVVGEGPEADRTAEAQLREEAAVSGFSDAEIAAATVRVVEDF